MGDVKFPSYNAAWDELMKFPGGRGRFHSTFHDDWSRVHPGANGAESAVIDNTITAGEEELPPSGQEPPPPYSFLDKRRLGEIKSCHRSPPRRPGRR